MKIKLAKTAGFCMGVRRAVDMVLHIAEHKGDEPIYTYGPLIHNPQTVHLLEKQGIHPIERAEEIKKGMIIIRAHGISPQEKKRILKDGVRIIDATCPKVVHVQSIIQKHAAQDYTILIVGDSEHPEVEGLLGHAYGKGIVVGSVRDVEALPHLEKVCVVAQTTQSKDEYAKISQRIAERFPGTLVFDTICDSTEKRQAEVKRLASEMDVVFIVGGHNSANTRRLAKISDAQGTPTFQIETAEDLKKIKLDGYEKIGISAGASTPTWIIRQIVRALSVSREHKPIAS
jgi:(E)-4-hydroxy-3-methyl-but-2-enyl pyrophosphate reductase